MSRPPELQGVQLLPDTPVLKARLAAVEAQLQELEARYAQESDPLLKNGLHAHIASLTRRKQWYLSRIRRTCPVQALGVSVSEDIGLAEGL